MKTQPFPLFPLFMALSLDAQYFCFVFGFVYFLFLILHGVTEAEFILSVICRLSSNLETFQATFLSLFFEPILPTSPESPVTQIISLCTYFSQI